MTDPSGGAAATTPVPAPPSEPRQRAWPAALVAVVLGVVLYFVAAFYEGARAYPNGMGLVALAAAGWTLLGHAVIAGVLWAFARRSGRHVAVQAYVAAAAITLTISVSTCFQLLRA